MKKTSRRRTSRRRMSLRRNSSSRFEWRRTTNRPGMQAYRALVDRTTEINISGSDRDGWAWDAECEIPEYRRKQGNETTLEEAKAASEAWVRRTLSLPMRRNSRRRTSLRRNRGDYRSGMLTDRDYMSLGDRITRSVLSTAGYKPHNNFEEDSKHWRQARIDALTALMIEGMLDGPRAGVEERDAAMHIAVDVARRNR